MGWASGSRVMEGIIDALLDALPYNKEARKKIYLKIIKTLEDEDWDTQDECMEIDDAFDEVMKELHSEF